MVTNQVEAVVQKDFFLSCLLPYEQLLEEKSLF